MPLATDHHHRRSAAIRMPSSSSTAVLRWLSLVGVIWVQSINGPNTDFPVYSSQLKNLLSISQVQLNNLAFASDAGKLFGFFSGIAAVYLPLWSVLTAGAAFGFVGYGVQYLFLIKKIKSLSYTQVFLLSVLAGNSICWINTVCYIICIHNFTSRRRVTVGLVTSYVGLSAKVFTVLADAIFDPGNGFKVAESYLFLNAVVPLSVAILTAPVLARQNGFKSGGSGSRRGFMVLFVIGLSTGIWAMISSVDSMSNLLSPRNHMLSLMFLLAAPLVVPLGELLGKKREITKVHGVSADKELTCLDLSDEVGKNSCEVEEEEQEQEEEQIEGDGDDVGVMEMVGKVEFWLYFFGYMFGPTVGLVFLNNLGQIVESRRLPKTSQLVSFASSFAFFGRFLPSLSHFLFPRWKVTGSELMAALMVPTSGAFFLLINPTNLALYIGTAIIGACTGAMISIAVTTTPELFGKKHFGVNHNVLVANIPIGSLLFGYTAAVFYQREGAADGGKSCIGARCYRPTFLLWGSLCSIGVFLFAILYIRTRQVRNNTL